MRMQSPELAAAAADCSYRSETGSLANLFYAAHQRSLPLAWISDAGGSSGSLLTICQRTAPDTGRCHNTHMSRNPTGSTGPTALLGQASVQPARRWIGCAVEFGSANKSNVVSRHRSCFQPGQCGGQQAIIEGHAIGS
jgi:hypothetical protein